MIKLILTNVNIRSCKILIEMRKRSKENINSAANFMLSSNLKFVTAFEKPVKYYAEHIMFSETIYFSY